jgi:hypothetical protein
VNVPLPLSVDDVLQQATPSLTVAPALEHPGGCRPASTAGHELSGPWASGWASVAMPLSMGAPVSWAVTPESMAAVGLPDPFEEQATAARGRRLAAAVRSTRPRTWGVRMGVFASTKHNTGDTRLPSTIAGILHVLEGHPWHLGQIPRRRVLAIPHFSRRAGQALSGPESATTRRVLLPLSSPWPWRPDELRKITTPPVAACFVATVRSSTAQGLDTCSFTGAPCGSFLGRPRRIGGARRLPRPKVRRRRRVPRMQQQPGDTIRRR